MSEKEETSVDTFCPPLQAGGVLSGRRECHTFW